MTTETTPATAIPPVPLVTRARVGDVDAMHRIINAYADQDEMLHRSHAELYEHLRDYFVVRVGDEVAGCVALHVLWKDLAELKALAVAPAWRSQGFGRLLAEAVIEDARTIGIDVVFALTYRPGFFETVGFRVVEMSQLPRKVWGECFRCPKFDDCHEIPVVFELRPGAFAEVNRTTTPQPIQLVPLWERPKP